MGHKNRTIESQSPILRLCPKKQLKSFPGVDHRSFTREIAVKPGLHLAVRWKTLKYMVADMFVIITTNEENRVNISIELQIKNQARHFV